MPLPLLELFRVLSSFAPERVSLANAPWEHYVDWAIDNGLAPLAAYNLEYRLAGSGAPEWARDRLLSIYQGAVNDNVMKLVTFKRALADLEGPRCLLLGGAAFAEALYPHVAFRPLLHVRLLTDDVPALTTLLAGRDLRVAADVQDASGALRRMSDGRTELLLHDRLLPADAELMARALPMKVYGPSVFRLAHEDAILVHCLLLGRAGYDVPIISFVDLRELLLGAPSTSGPYSQKFDAAAVRERAERWRLERTVYVALSITARLFPEVTPLLADAIPKLRPATRKLLDRLVVDPVATLGASRHLRGLDRLRRLLSGAR